MRTYRKSLVWMSLVMLLLSVVSASAETAASPRLYPAKGENGLWGYIDAAGRWVIEPRYHNCWEFRGDYAIAALYPPGTMDEQAEDCQGVIDRQGNWVVEPRYSFDAGYDGQYYGGKDTGVWFVTRWSDMVWGEDEEGEERILVDNKVGFFDIPSGCFSGLQWSNVWCWCSDSPLIPVVDDNFLAGYALRTTGEQVIPCQYFAVDPSNFYEGVAAVAYEDEDGNPIKFFLIDETGKEIPLPEGIEADGYGASEGRIVIMDSETELLGFADLEGNVIIAPRFIYTNPFEAGRAVVQFPEEDWGLIDREGNILRRGMAADDWWGFSYENGCRSLRTGEHRFSMLDEEDNVIFTLEMENLVSLGLPMENGLCWFRTDISGKQSYWLDRKAGLVDWAGNIISPAQWDLKDFTDNGFLEGRQPVGQDGKWGYLDDFGNLVIPLIYDDVAAFENGLAWVCIGDRFGYIDREGREVITWTDEDWN